MSVVTDRDFRRWAIQSEGDEVAVLLLEITHASLTDPIRVSSDPTEFIMLHEETQEPIYGTRSNGDVYYTLPFAFVFPDQPEGNTTPKATLRVDNVNRQYVRVLRDTEITPICRIRLVFASSPDVFREEIGPYRLGSVTYNVTAIEGTLMPDDPRSEPVPALNFLPSSFPGLF